MQQVAHEPNHEQGLRVSKHIFVGNSRLVTALTHQAGIDTTEQAAKLYYYHADHLQSAQFITDANGEKYEHIEYTPYGELWTYKSKTAMLFLTTYNNFLAKQPAGLIEETAPGVDKLPLRFTGKELDTETGLYYYGARYLDPKYSRWLSGDPAITDYMAGTSAGEGGVYNTVNLSVYHYAGNNPVKYTDPDGRATWIDQDGLVRNVINDGDLNIYQWSGNGVYENIEGPLSKESVIDNENPWKVVGETLFWDAFISPDTNKPVGKLILGESIDAYIDDLHAKAESYGKDKTFRLSLPNKGFDIKTQYPGHDGFSYNGFLFHGKYVTLREAGNILAGMNAALFGMEFDDFQKGAGALHAKGLWGVGMYKVFGSVYGPAPKYGENDYQYTRSLYGYNIILRSK